MFQAHEFRNCGNENSHSEYYIMQSFVTIPMGLQEQSKNLTQSSPASPCTHP